METSFVYFAGMYRIGGNGRMREVLGCEKWMKCAYIGRLAMNMSVKIVCT